LGLSVFFAGVAALAGVAFFAGVAAFDAVLTTAVLVGVAARTFAGLADLEAARLGDTTAFTDSLAFLAAALLGLVSAFFAGVEGSASLVALAAFFLAGAAFLGFSAFTSAAGTTGVAFLTGAAAL
jgi:hypothetical protein